MLSGSLNGPEAWPDIGGRIVDGAHLLPVRVYYEDTDFSGVVYHANYLRFAERGRSDFLRLAGVSHTALLAGPARLAFAVHRMEIEFLKPARIDDLLEVRTRYLKAGGARLHAAQAIFRVGDEGGLEEIWRAAVHAACVDGAGRPHRLPHGVRAALAPFVAAAGG